MSLLNGTANFRKKRPCIDTTVRRKSMCILTSTQTPTSQHPCLYRPVRQSKFPHDQCLYRPVRQKHLCILTSTPKGKFPKNVYTHWYAANVPICPCLYRTVRRRQNKAQKWPKVFTRWYLTASHQTWACLYSVGCRNDGLSPVLPVSSPRSGECLTSFPCAAPPRT
jgi:hypothetical protein